MDYKFRVQTKEEQEETNGGALSSEICQIYDLTKDDVNPEDIFSLAFGKLQARFGQPICVTKNYENMYRYALCAETGEGEKIYLYAYNGPTGPAIGGYQDDKRSEYAAKALADYIKDAISVDFETEAYYMDGMCKVIIGVKDGKPYITGAMLDPDNSEIEELLANL